MRVVYIVESLPPILDGITQVMSRLLETLDAEGVEYLLISPFKDKNPPWSDCVRQVPYVPFPLYADYRFSLPWITNWEKDLDAFKPDVLHCVANPTPLGFKALAYAKKRGIVAVSSYQTHYVSYFKYYGMPKWIEKLGWHILRNFHGPCDMTYVPAPSAKKELAAHGLKNTELWGHGVDLSRYSPRHKNIKLRKQVGAENIPILFMISRLVKEKDLGDLIQIDRCLRAMGQKYKWVIAGEGPYKKTLMRGLPDATFLGRIEGKAVSEWYATSDIFVFPSTTEAFGLVCLEALASGLPVVGANKYGTTDLVKDGVTGFLAKPNDAGDFAKKIRILLENKTLRTRMSKRAPLSLKTETWTKINKGLLASYRKLIQKNNRR